MRSTLPGPSPAPGRSSSIASHNSTAPGWMASHTARLTVSRKVAVIAREPRVDPDLLASRAPRDLRVVGANSQPAAGGQDMCLRGGRGGLERVERALAPDVTVWA